MITRMGKCDWPRQNDKGPAVASEAYLSFGRLVIAEIPKLPPKRSSKPDACAERVRAHNDTKCIICPSIRGRDACMPGLPACRQWASETRYSLAFRPPGF